MEKIIKKLDNGAALEFEGNNVTVIFPSGVKRHTSVMNALQGLYPDLLPYIPEEIIKAWGQHKKEMGALKKRLGIEKFSIALEGKHTLKPSEITEEGTLPELQAGKYTIGQHDGQYIAEVTYRSDIDSYTLETYWFEKKPALRDIRRAIKLAELCELIERRGMSFECWECGQEVYWFKIKLAENGEKAQAVLERAVEEYIKRGRERKQ